MSKKFVYLVSLQFFLSLSVIGQMIPERIILSRVDKQNKDVAVGKINITTPIEKSLIDYLQVVDTMDSNSNENYKLKVKGFNIQFKLIIQRDSFIYQSGIKQILSIESRTKPYQLWNYDVTNLTNADLALISEDLRKKTPDNPVLQTAFQSCISYSLESIFRSYGIDPEPFFYRRSIVAEHAGIENILKNLFVKVETLEDVKKSTLNKSKELHKEQAFLLFRNYLGEPIHACFNLSGRTWSKNGMWPYTSYTSPISVVNFYNNQNKINNQTSESTVELIKLGSVTNIEIYRLNLDIFK